MWRKIKNTARKMFKSVYEWLKPLSKDKKEILKPSKRFVGVIVIFSLLSSFYIVNTDRFQVSSAFVGGLILTLGFYLIKKWKLKLFSFNKISTGNLLLAGILFLISMGIDNILYVLNGHQTTNNDTFLQQTFSLDQILWMSLIGIIIGPFIEELSYRAIGLKYVFRNFEITGVIVMSLIFAFAHYPNNLIEFLIYFQSSIIYSIIYLKSGRFELVFIIHVLNNSLTFIPMLLENF